MIYTAPGGGPIRSSPFATPIKCSRGGQAQIGNVIALHTLLGSPPFTHSQQASFSTIGTPVAGQTDWMTLVGGWVKGEPVGGAGWASTNSDPDNVVKGRYLNAEIRVTLAIDGGAASEVYDHKLWAGPHTGAYPGTAIYEYWNGLLAASDDYSDPPYEYTLHDDGSETTAGVKADMRTVHPIFDAVNLAMASFPGSPDYIVDSSSSIEVVDDRATATDTFTSALGRTAVVVYNYTLTALWNKDDIQVELDLLLSKVNLSNAAAKYYFEDEDVTRTLLTGGESVTVTHEGPVPASAGGPKAVRFVIRSNSAWTFATAEAANGWLSFNLNDVSWASIQANGDGSTTDAGALIGYRGGNWAMMKSLVIIPAGSYTQTIKAYQQPSADSISWTDAHAASPTPANNSPGGETPPSGGPADSVTALAGGVTKSFSRGAWITLTKVTAGAPPSGPIDSDTTRVDRDARAIDQ